jgi:hypothetical protein
MSGAPLSPGLQPGTRTITEPILRPGAPLSPDL